MVCLHVSGRERLDCASVILGRGSDGKGGVCNPLPLIACVRVVRNHRPANRPRVQARLDPNHQFNLLTGLPRFGVVEDELKQHRIRGTVGHHDFERATGVRAGNCYVGVIFPADQPVELDHHWAVRVQGRAKALEGHPCLAGHRQIKVLGGQRHLDGVGIARERAALPDAHRVEVDLVDLHRRKACGCCRLIHVLLCYYDAACADFRCHSLGERIDRVHQIESHFVLATSLCGILYVKHHNSGAVVEGRGIEVNRVRLEIRHRRARARQSSNLNRGAASLEERNRRGDFAGDLYRRAGLSRRLLDVLGRKFAATHEANLRIQSSDIRCLVGPAQLPPRLVSFLRGARFEIGALVHAVDVRRHCGRPI